MSKKWYNVFVSTDAPSGESEPPDEAGQSSDAARTVARIAASVPTEPAFSAPVQNPTSFDEIYSLFPLFRVALEDGGGFDRFIGLLPLALALGLAALCG